MYTQLSGTFQVKAIEDLTDEMDLVHLADGRILIVGPRTVQMYTSFERYENGQQPLGVIDRPVNPVALG